MKQLRRVAAILLDPQRPAYSLRPEVVELVAIFADSATTSAASSGEISSGETLTPHGLALSPTMAAMCADDYVRTIEFIRGTQAAITDVRKQFPDRPARVLYVGCGPFATLAVPLMATFPPAEVAFTLLDAHADSISSAESVVDSLGLSESVTSFETLDASSYRVCPDQPPDVILIEIMQAALESEPQVAVTRHLLRQAPDAILVPEEVRLELILMDPTHEFDTGAVAENREPAPRDRIDVGPVFVLNRETVSSWDDDSDRRLPACTVRIPDPMEERYEAMIFTIIRTYQSHILEDYDSGLTYPRPPVIEGDFEPGDEIEFRYDLGERPRLIGEVRARSR